MAGEERWRGGDKGGYFAADSFFQKGFQVDFAGVFVADGFFTAGFLGDGTESEARPTEGSR